jgi:hypothetical protein
MMMNLRLLLLYVFMVPAVASAEAPGHIASESRDAATAYVLTQNFIIGRTARDCFEILGRIDTPKSFVTLWQNRNAKYFSAALTYTNRRLAEAEALSGVTARNEVASALNSAISRAGSGAVSDFFEKGEKREICKRVIGLMESGAFNIDSRSPMFGELQALVQFMEGQ